MQLLRGAIRTYAWGSRTAIAEFTGRPAPTAHPEAELWLGAHPADPAGGGNPPGPRILLGGVAPPPPRQLRPGGGGPFRGALPLPL